MIPSVRDRRDKITVGSKVCFLNGNRTATGIVDSVDDTLVIIHTTATPIHKTIVNLDLCLSIRHMREIRKYVLCNIKQPIYAEIGKKIRKGMVGMINGTMMNFKPVDGDPMKRSTVLSVSIFNIRSQTDYLLSKI